MIDALLLLLLQSLPHLTLQLRLLPAPVQHRLTRRLQLLPQSVELLLKRLRVGLLGSEPLRVRHRAAHVHLDLPPLAPVRVARQQLGLRQPRTHLPEHVEHAPALRVDAVPRAPAASQPGVHQALHADLLQVIDALLLFELHLGFHLLPHEVFVARLALQRLFRRR